MPGIIQTASNKQIAIMRQLGKGLPASGAGADGFDVLASQGLKLNKGSIPNGVIRRDGQKKKQRAGMRSSGAVYKLPLSQGTLDPHLETAFRGTWKPAFDITAISVLGGSAPAVSITTTANSVVLNAGSPRLQGASKGMMFQLIGHSTVANNGKWIRVVDVTANAIITPAGALVADAVPDATFTIHFAKSLTNPQVMIERYHTIEEVGQDISKSILGTDMKLCKFDFNAQPEALIEMTETWMGLDAKGQEVGVPILPNPLYSTTSSLVMMDGSIRIGGVDQDVLSGFQFSWDMGGEVPKILGKKGPDVILGQGGMTGSFSALRRDLQFFNAFDLESTLEFFVVCQENDVLDPMDFTSVFIGNVGLTDSTTGIAQTGADTETVPWGAGIDDIGGANQLTTVVICSSAP